MKKAFILSLLYLMIGTAYPQSLPENFQLSLEEFAIPDFSGVHSAVIAEEDGKWLILGGRINGLHGFLPPSAFPNPTQNNQAWVIDPQTSQVWTTPLLTLPTTIFDQITASNAAYARQGDYLYIAGGYGSEQVNNDIITMPYLAAVHVPNLIQAILNGQAIDTHFRQISDSRMAICGGNMHNLNGRFQLVMGHRFDGRYNAHNGPSFVQQYSNEIRSFEIQDDGTNFSIQNYAAVYDSLNFHRRDYNLVPQKFPGNITGFTAFTGVFQYAINRPWLNSIDILPNGSGYSVGTWQQKLNQYHSAKLPVYDSLAEAMHTLFFGGIGQYFPDSLNPNVWNEDTLIPFTKTISLISRWNGSVDERALSLQMPAYLGANAEFIPAENNVFDENGILILQRLPNADSVLVGYIVGGIESALPNVFMGNEAQSWPSNRIFRVFLRRTGTTDISANWQNSLNIAPNPSSDFFHFSGNEKAEACSLRIIDAQGKELENLLVNVHASDTWTASWDARKYSKGFYYLNFRDGNKQITRSLIKR